MHTKTDEYKKSRKVSPTELKADVRRRHHWLDYPEYAGQKEEDFT